jgi:hypothetical protein
MRFSLVSRFPLARHGTGVATEFLLHPGGTSTFILRQVEGDGMLRAPMPEDRATPEAAQRTLASEIDRWAPIIRACGGICGLALRRS